MTRNDYSLFLTRPSRYRLNVRRERVEVDHGQTYSGHPVCCAAAALANLNVLANEHLVERTRRREGAVAERDAHGARTHAITMLEDVTARTTAT